MTFAIVCVLVFVVAPFILAQVLSGWTDRSSERQWVEECRRCREVADRAARHHR